MRWRAPPRATTRNRTALLWRRRAGASARCGECWRTARVPESLISATTFSAAPPEPTPVSATRSRLRGVESLPGQLAAVTR